MNLGFFEYFWDLRIYFQDLVIFLRVEPSVFFHGNFRWKSFGSFWNVFRTFYHDSRINRIFEKYVLYNKKERKNIFWRKLEYFPSRKCSGTQLECSRLTLNLDSGNFQIESRRRKWNAQNILFWTFVEKFI